MTIKRSRQETTPSAGVKESEGDGSAKSRSTTWIGARAHCQTLMPGERRTESGRGYLRPHTGPGSSGARPVRAKPQGIGEDSDRVVALEGDEGGRFGQPLAEGRLDSCTERAEALGR